jgi:predicted MFS family arabinose efflux permease
MIDPLKEIKNTYGGLPTSIWILAITQLINRAGAMVVFFLAIYLKKELALEFYQVGWAMAVYGIGSILGIKCGGYLTDRIGFYKVMVASLLIGAFCFVAVSFIQNYSWLLVGLFAMAFSSEAYRPANMAAVSLFSDSNNYLKAITLNRLAINLGFAIGPALGGLLATIQFQYVFWADAGSSLLAAGMAFVFLKSHKVVQSSSNDGVSDPTASPYRDKWFLWFLPMVSLYSISFLQLFTTMTIYYEEVEHLTKIQIGQLLALNGGIVAVFEMFLITKIGHRGRPMNFIAAGTLLLICCYLLLYVAHGFLWMVVITVFASLSEMFAMPFMNTFMNDRSNASNKGQYSSLYIIAWSLAHIATPLLATGIAQAAGYGSLWTTMLIFSLGSLVIGRCIHKGIAKDFDATGIKK